MQKNNKVCFKVAFFANGVLYHTLTVLPFSVALIYSLSKEESQISQLHAVVVCCHSFYSNLLNYCRKIVYKVPLCRGLF